MTIFSFPIRITTTSVDVVHLMKWDSIKVRKFCNLKVSHTIIWGFFKWYSSVLANMLKYRMRILQMAQLRPCSHIEISNFHFSFFQVKEARVCCTSLDKIGNNSASHREDRTNWCWKIEMNNIIPLWYTSKPNYQIIWLILAVNILVIISLSYYKTKICKLTRVLQKFCDFSNKTQIIPWKNFWFPNAVILKMHFVLNYSYFLSLPNNLIRQSYQNIRRISFHRAIYRNLETGNLHWGLNPENMADIRTIRSAFHLVSPKWLHTWVPLHCLGECEFSSWTSEMVVSSNPNWAVPINWPKNRHGFSFHLKIMHMSNTPCI